MPHPSAGMGPAEHHIEVVRTARYHTLGAAADADEVWYLIHGYGQLARELLDAARALAGAERLIVAPEALSRFYSNPRRHAVHAEAPVGASWMTRECRDEEIRDYVRYLDAVHAEVMPGLSRPPSRTCVLGFSQGVATAARWVAFGAVRPHMLVLWGSAPPAGLEAAAGRFAGLRVVCVSGDHDEVAPAAELERSRGALTALGARVKVVSFSGGHRLDSAVLTRLRDEV